MLEIDASVVACIVAVTIGEGILAGLSRISFQTPLTIRRAPSGVLEYQEKTVRFDVGARLGDSTAGGGLEGNRDRMHLMRKKLGASKA